MRKVPRYTVYPKYALRDARATACSNAIETIKVELKERLEHLYKANKLVEAQRLQQRTQFDVEMMAEIGYCQGIENYSRHLTRRCAGEPPPTLFDYLPADALLVVDESHVTIPQLGAMYKGDRSRKETLVEFGFRLPSALDNRPLQVRGMGRPRAAHRVCVGDAGRRTSCSKSGGNVVELVVRPTGLVDPEVEVRPVRTQVDDLLSEMHERVAIGDRVLVTTLTKRMAENLTEYLEEHGVRVRYLHSDIETVERVEIIRDLRLGKFDVLVGINLLREGLDMPEVSLVAILDADKEGFLRSTGSLIQTIGRAARNLRGKAILYADADHELDEGGDRRNRPSPRETAGRLQRRRTASRRNRWCADHRHHGRRAREARERSRGRGSRGERRAVAEKRRRLCGRSAPIRLAAMIKKLEAQMYKHAENLEFEDAARVRDQIHQLRERALR